MNETSNYGTSYDNGDLSWLWGIFAENLTFWDFFLLLISLFVLAAWILSIIFVLWGGLLLILSGGKDEKIKPAINTIRYAVIGIIVTVLSIFLFPILWRLLWLDVERYAQPKKIFEKIEDIWNRIFSASSEGSSYSPNSFWSSTSGGWYKTGNGLDEFPDDFSDL